MRARVLLAAAVVVLAAVAAVWFWPMERPATIVLPTPSPVSAAAAPREIAAPLAPPTPVIATTPAPAPAQPAVVSSSVMVGAPMVRTTPRPVGANPAAAPTGKDSSPAPQQPDGVREMEDVRLMFRNYLTRIGENPVGSNAEIMKAMMGRNSAAAKLGPPPGHTMNADGELVDFWDTPYFFHQLSRDKMEVRSAGPDKTMWTQDDLVTK